jgi:hypothetical protein
MRPFSPCIHLVRHVLLAALVVASLVACNTGSAATPAPSRTSIGSGGACATAPDPGTPAGWGVPSTAPSVIPVLINAPGELACGPNRFLFSFIDAKSNVPVGAPNRTASVELFDLARDPAKPAITSPSTFVWAIEGERGIYVANVTFAEAGVWGAAFTTQSPGAAPETVRVTFQVAPSTPVVRVGQRAPATKTPTAADVGGDVSKISTDTKPDPAFYTTSVDDALTKHEPFVLVFATPKFCQSAQCGPTLDRIKPFAARYPGVTFIHAEPYKLQLESGQLQPVLTNGQLTPTDAVDKWGLLSEPWIFVVDRNGVVRGSFELIFSNAELSAALDAVK